MYVKAYRTVEGVAELATYTQVKVTFAPSVDLAGTSLPVNEFQVDIVTGDTIEIGAYAELYDDLDTLYARYWIVYAEHVDAHVLRLRAQSDVALLDRVTLEAVYYEDAPIADVLDQTIVRNSGAVGIVVPMDYTLDADLEDATITGYCPRQTARERLTWVCLVIGGFVKDAFNSEIEILQISSGAVRIPISRTYWKPDVIYNDHVTALRVVTWAFAEGTPSTTDEYVTVGNTTYIVTKGEIMLQNNNIPAGAPENIITVDSVSLINSYNASAILNRLAAWYFMRTEIDLSAVNNGEYQPGDRVRVYADEDTLMYGYINSLSFTFGQQAKTEMHLTASSKVVTGKLKVVYKWGTKSLNKNVYYLSVGAAYRIENPYFDMTMGGHRYVFRPETAAVTGTMQAGGATVTVQYDVALDLYKGVLHVISVDQVTEISGIGVIS